MSKNQPSNLSGLKRQKFDYGSRLTLLVGRWDVEIAQAPGLTDKALAPCFSKGTSTSQLMGA